MPENRDTFADRLDTYDCPTHGKRRRSQGEVRQEERDETCVYVCTACGEVADPECVEEGRGG
jgi:hypothetical protein